MQASASKRVFQAGCVLNKYVARQLHLKLNGGPNLESIGVDF